MATVTEPLQTRRRAAVVASNSAWLALDTAVGVAVSLVLSVTVARSVGPGVLGVYNFANWMLGAGIVVLTNGVTYGMQLFAAELLGRGDIAGVRTVLRHGLRWQIGLSLLLTLIGVASTWVFAPPQFHAALLLAVASIAPAVMVSVPAAGLGAAQAFAPNVLTSLAGVIVNLVATLAALRFGLGLAGVTGALLLSRLVDAAGRHWAWQRIRRRLERELGTTQPAADSDLDLARFNRVSFSSSLLLLIESIVWDRSEFFFLSRFSALRELAFYSLGFNIVQQVMLIPRLFTRALSANLLVERGRAPENVIRLTTDGMRYSFLISAPLLFGLVATSSPLIALLYGATYRPVASVLTVAAALTLLRGALAPVQSLLYMLEQQAFLIRWNLAVGALNIGLDFWLIPTHGAMGAAWANGIAQGVAAVGLIAFAVRRFQLAIPLGDFARAVLACVPMVIVARSLAVMLPPWAALFTGVPVGAVLYVVGLRTLGVLRPVDADRLQPIASRLPTFIRPTFGRVVSLVVGRRAGTPPLRRAL